MEDKVPSSLAYSTAWVFFHKSTRPGGEGNRVGRIKIYRPVAGPLVPVDPPRFRSENHATKSQ